METESRKSFVAVVPCQSYEEEQVYEAIRQGIRMLGGIEHFVKNGEKILVKPNFLSPSTEEKAVVTHPSVIRGVLRLLQEEGYKQVSFGDSPGHGSCEAAAKKIGLTSEKETFGAVCARMSEEVLVPFPEGMTAKKFYFAKEVTEADAIINLCKMKTHALERVTGAVKNVYGLICGYRKAAGHVEFPNASVFARMLADIHRCTKPRLHIMDGIVAMEGNGPGSGTPISMNVLIFSEDPVALDTVFCHLIDLNPELVPTNAQGAAMGIGTYRQEEIEILLRDQGQDRTVSMEELKKQYGNPGFDADRKGEKKTFLSRYSKAMTALARRPVIDEKKCIRCGICVSHCPVPGKAVDFRKGKEKPPVYDYRKCIRCYCCQEMCPRHAITVKGKRSMQ